jgi:hypothetical protein
MGVWPGVCLRVCDQQERLTRTIAHAHSRSSGEAQEWVRLMLSCVGRGGDGQRIRDEILHIMHRWGHPDVVCMLCGHSNATRSRQALSSSGPSV